MKFQAALLIFSVFAVMNVELTVMLLFGINQKTQHSTIFQPIKFNKTPL